MTNHYFFSVPADAKKFSYTEQLDDEETLEYLGAFVERNNQIVLACTEPGDDNWVESYFGDNTFSELPSEIQEAAKEAGLTYENGEWKKI